MAYLSALRRPSSSLLLKTLTLSSSSSSSSSSSCSSSSLSRISSRHRFSSALFNQLVPDSARPPVRFRTTTSASSESDSPRPRWADAAAAELDDTVIIEGCDFEHWLVIMRFADDPKPSVEEMVDTYIKTLSAVVGSEEEAKKKIYSVSTTTYTGFGALVSRELSKNLKGLPGVLWVLPDSYLDVPSKDYGGDLLIDGKIVPRPEFRFGRQEPGKTMKSDFSGMEEREGYEEREKGTVDSEESFLMFERLRETIEHLKHTKSENLEGTRGEPTKNGETTTEDGNGEDLEGHHPVLDRLRETTKTMRHQPQHEDLEESAALFDRLSKKNMKVETQPSQQSKTEESEGHVKEGEEEETAALFDRLREEMKNMKIEPVKNNSKDSDWSDIWPDEYYEKVEEPKTKMTQEQLDAMKVQIQEFKRELTWRKAEDEDG